MSTTATALWVTPQGLRKLRRERADLDHWLQRLHDRLERICRTRATEQSLTQAEEHILENRLEVVEALLGRAHTMPAGRAHKAEVRAGDTVYLRHGDNIRAVTLVNVWEADALHGRISVLSPIGQVLLGRSQGERVRLTTLDGVLPYEILKII